MGPKMKTIAIILIFSLLCSSFGCFSTKAYTDNNAIRMSLENKEEISLTTKHLDKYSLHLPNTYKFKNDTVFGLVRSGKWNVRSYQSIKIPFRSVHKIEKKEIDATKTILLVAAIGGLIYCISSFDPGYSMSFK